MDPTMPAGTAQYIQDDLLPATEAVLRQFLRVRPPAGAPGLDTAPMLFKACGTVPPDASCLSGSSAYLVGVLYCLEFFCLCDALFGECPTCVQLLGYLLLHTFLLTTGHRGSQVKVPVPGGMLRLQPDCLQPWESCQRGTCGPRCAQYTDETHCYNAVLPRHLKSERRTCMEGRADSSCTVEPPGQGLRLCAVACCGPHSTMAPSAGHAQHTPAPYRRRGRPCHLCDVYIRPRV